MARRNKPDKGPVFPAWFYGPNEGECDVFNSPEDVPEGWGRKPGVPETIIVVQTTEILNRDELVAELKARGIDINPIWGDAHLKRIVDGDVSSTR